LCRSSAAFWVQVAKLELGRQRNSPRVRLLPGRLLRTPVPFTRQQQAIQANGGRPISVAQQRQMEPQTTTRPNVRIAPPAREVVPQNDRRNAVEDRRNQPNQTNPPANVNPGNQGNPSNRPTR